MITTKKELSDWIKQDKARYKNRKFLFLSWFFGDESYGTLVFLRRLRKTEYYYNTLNRRNLFSLFRFGYSFFLDNLFINC